MESGNSFKKIVLLILLSLLSLISLWYFLRTSTLSGYFMKKKSKVAPLNVGKKKKHQTQVELFQKSMKLLLICGQCIGLHPVIGITSKDVSKMRFTYFSLRFLYSCVIGASQFTFTAMAFHKLVTSSVNISILTFISFFAGTCATTCLFVRIASKWPLLMKKIADSSLDKYIDATVHVKCFTITVITLALATVEHVLSQYRKIINSVHCATENTTMYENFLEMSFPWLKQMKYSLHIPIGVFLHFITIASTINWNYSDLFIVCMSMYLVSILKKINKTIEEVDIRIKPTLLDANEIGFLRHLLKKTVSWLSVGLTEVIIPFYHPTIWCTIREDYTKAARLVTSFDDVISGVMLVSFASNLFFICLQLFHILAHGFEEKMGSLAHSDPCVLNITRNLFDNLIYFIFSFIFVLGRFLAVSLVAASVHTVSRESAPALYMVPSNAYCNEVQRFIEQVHGDTIALSGLKFFYITKGLVLTVAGTIVTYELVLLQFSGQG